MSGVWSSSTSVAPGHLDVARRAAGAPGTGGAHGRHVGEGADVGDAACPQLGQRVGGVPAGAERERRQGRRRAVPVRGRAEQLGRGQRLRQPRRRGAAVDLGAARRCPGPAATVGARGGRRRCGSGGGSAAHATPRAPGTSRTSASATRSRRRPRVARTGPGLSRHGAPCRRLGRRARPGPCASRSGSPASVISPWPCTRLGVDPGQPAVAVHGDARPRP